MTRDITKYLMLATPTDLTYAISSTNKELLHNTKDLLVASGVEKVTIMELDDVIETNGASAQEIADFILE